MHPILLLALLIAVLFGISYVKRLPPAQRPRALLIGAAVLLVLLAMTGKLNPIVAGIAGLLAAGSRLLGVVQTFSGLAGMGQKFKSATSGQSQGQTSTVRTDWLAMELDHDSGNMRGEVLRGRHAGARLDALDMASLLALHSELTRTDARSRALLEAWLDRHHGSAWRAQAGPASSDGAVATTGDMTPGEAREVLGVPVDASSDDIVSAHRRLMQKLHPDRGGSDFLAAQVNRAKAVLLREV